MLDRVLKIASYLLLLATVLFIVAPVAMIVWTAFLPQEGGVLPTQGFTLYWFDQFLYDPSFMSAVIVSLELAALVGAIAISISILAGYALTHYNFPGRALLNSFLIAPSGIPGVVKGAGLLFLFVYIGFTNSFGDLVVAQVMISLPLGVLAIVPSYLALDKNVELAARNLGATGIQSFVKVTLPLIKPGILACSIFVLSISFTDAATSIFLVNPQTTTLAVLLLGWTSTAIGNTFAAISTVIVAATLVIVLLVDRAVGLDRVVKSLEFR